MALANVLKKIGIVRRDADIQFSVPIAEGTKLDGDIQFGDKDHGGILHGAGVSATPYVMAGDSKSALSYYISTTSTADSNRVAYFRIYLGGAAGGGEAVRAFGTINGVSVAVARGCHISVNYSGASAAVTGESMAGKFTYHIPNRAASVGTSSVIQAELYTDGASADISGTMALFHGTVSGAGAGTVDAKTYVLNLSGVTNGSGEMVYRAQNEPTWTSKTCLIKCLINGNVTYLVGVEL